MTRVIVDAETLKDLYWYIKGAIDQSRLEIGDCSFDSNHIKALKKLLNHYKKKQKILKDK